VLPPGAMIVPPATHVKRRRESYRGASSSRDTCNVTCGRTFSRAQGNGRHGGDQVSRAWGARRSHVLDHDRDGDEGHGLKIKSTSNPRTYGDASPLISAILRSRSLASLSKSRRRFSLSSSTSSRVAALRSAAWWRISRSAVFAL